MILERVQTCGIWRFGRLAALAAILKHRVEALAAIAGLWLLVAIRAFDTVLTSAP